MNFIVFCLTGPGLESMINHIGGNHANHYTSDGVTEQCGGVKQVNGIPTLPS
jgi:hypothetical protein